MSQSPSSGTLSEPTPGAGERPGPVPEDDRVTGVSLPLRLYASKRTHRLIPAPAALALAAAVGPAVRQRRNPAERTAAETFMRDLLLHTPRAGEAEALGREWLKEKSRLRELFWRPWLLRHSRVEGVEHWHTAHRDGSGCLIVLGHLVATWAVPAILALQGFEHYLIVSPHYWKPMPAGYEGLATLHRRREYGERIFGTSRLLLSDSDPSRLLDLLQAGESIAIAFDVPGFAETPFLGRKLALGGGLGTLAFKTKAPILPVIPQRHGSRIDLKLLPPIDPAQFSDPRALRAAIAQKFEPFVISQPETVELAWYPSPLVSGIPPDPSVMEPERAS